MTTHRELRERTLKLTAFERRVLAVIATDPDPFWQLCHSPAEKNLTTRTTVSGAVNRLRNKALVRPLYRNEPDPRLWTLSALGVRVQRRLAEELRLKENLKKAMKGPGYGYGEKVKNDA